MSRAKGNAVGMLKVPPDGRSERVAHCGTDRFAGNPTLFAVIFAMDYDMISLIRGRRVTVVPWSLLPNPQLMNTFNWQKKNSTA